MSNIIIDVSSQSFECDVNQSQLPVLLDLWAPWCSPCRALAPVLEKISGEYDGELQVAKLNVEDFPEMQRQLGVRGIPTLILFKNGKEVSRMVGGKSRDELRRWLEKAGIVSISSPQENSVEPIGRGAFYADSGLKEFLYQRLRSHAEAERITYGRMPFWEEGKGTLACGFMNSADLAVFSAVTGLAQSFAVALEFVSPIIIDVASVDRLVQAIPLGADTSDVAIKLIQRFYCDSSMNWSRILGDEQIDGVLAEWNIFCERVLANQKIAKTEWDSLAQRIEVLKSSDEAADRDVQNAFLAGLMALTPIPAHNEGAAWTSAMLMIGKYLQIVLAQDKLGWTKEDYALERVREAWFVSREAEQEGGIFTEEALKLAHQEWMNECGVLQQRQQVFMDHFEQNMLPVVEQVQGVFVRLLAETERLQVDPA